MLSLLIISSPFLCSIPNKEDKTYQECQAKNQLILWFCQVSIPHVHIGRTCAAVHAGICIISQPFFIGAFALNQNSAIITGSTATFFFIRATEFLETACAVTNVWAR